MSLVTELSKLGSEHRLTWSEVERLIELAEDDVKQAVRDVEFDHWWNGHILATRQRMALVESLGGRRD